MSRRPSTRPFVEDSLALDVRHLHRERLLPNAKRNGGPLTDGPWSSATWLQLPNGPKAWVSVELDLGAGDGVVWSESSCVGGGTAVTSARLTSTEQPLGGRRWWLECHCWVRCAVLYWHEGAWRCQGCAGLRYLTTAVSDKERALIVSRRRIARLERRVGAHHVILRRDEPGHFAGYLPPGGMWASTWGRLRPQLEKALEDEWVATVAFAEAPIRGRRLRDDVIAS